MAPLTEQERSLRAITEADLQRTIVQLARDLGWGVPKSAADRMAEEALAYGVQVPALDGLIYHPRYSLGSEPGWPDLTLVRRKDRRLVYAELKAEKGVLSPRQAQVLDLLASLSFELPELPDDFPTNFAPGSYLGGVLEGLQKALRDAPRIEVFVWRPSDLASGRIAEVLR